VVSEKMDNKRINWNFFYNITGFIFKKENKEANAS